MQILKERWNCDSWHD